jgi:hypothetical protein
MANTLKSFYKPKQKIQEKSKEDGSTPPRNTSSLNTPTSKTQQNKHKWPHQQFYPCRSKTPRVCLDVGIFARKWIGLKIPNLRWKGNDLHFQFHCLDVHRNSCWNQRIAPNSKSCLDVQNMELNFDLGLGFFSLYISKFLFLFKFY